jgi:hypothetical protein
MNAIAVFVKKSGVLVPCKAYPEPDGAVWRCAICDLAIVRASFGVLNGMWRCQCGCEVEVVMDGCPVDLEAAATTIHDRDIVGTVGDEPPQNLELNAPEKPKRKRARKLTDEDFLRECGIAIKEEEPC